MRIRIASMLAAIALLASGAFAQQAQEPKLKVGDKAPPLSDGAWVKGEPVSEFESGKVYVVEFWATWCGPCIAAIPHVTELQKKYADKGLVVIGQNVWETQPEKVKPFVEEMGDKMGYRVVMDEPSGQDGYMAKNWMAAAGRNGIPCSFIIDKEGKIAWIGHPMAMDKPLEEIIAGTFDPKKAEAEAAAARKSAEHMTKLREFAQAGEWDDLYAYADKAIPEMEDAQALNELAWRIVDPENPFPQQNLEVALKAAEKANKLSNNESGMILDTLARVYWLRGDKAKALETQERAVEKNDEPMFTEELAQRLEEYRKGQDQ